MKTVELNRRKSQSQKQVKEGNNSIKIWCTVTSKQYLLYRLMI